ncbi:MAG: hypothetical protein QM771_13875 [Nitrospira sp.]
MQPIDLDEMETQAASCKEVTLSSDQLRQLIRLAKLGQAREEYDNHHF